MYYLAPLPPGPPVASMAEEAAMAPTAASATTIGESQARRNLNWKRVPSLTSLTLPTVTADDDIFMDPRFTMSPNLPGNAAAAAFLAASGMVHPATAAAAAAAYGLGACNPNVMLERLGPHILRSHVSTVQSKAIPHNDGIDLEGYRRRDPREWSMDDVIGWMISVAKKRGIPVEDMNMHRFSNCTGTLLSLMSQQNFLERDSTYGGLLYSEFRRLIAGDESSRCLDSWDRVHKDDVQPGTSMLDSGSSSTGTTSTSLLSTLAAATEAAAVASSLYSRIAAANAVQCGSVSRVEMDDVFGGPAPFLKRESVIKAAGFVPGTASTLLGAVANLGSLPDLRNLKEIKEPEGMPPLRPTLSEAAAASIPFRSVAPIDTMSLTASTIPKFAAGKIKKKINDGACSLTLSGKPRKRSQHTRGNKLWEFIRSALNNPATNPSVVKWENEGDCVFRIVDSEKLARLWGDKKNNKRMTYEKLSRAMRTYYEKQILVPVPKTGLYPKKLVYKFGPNAKSWQQKEAVTAKLPIGEKIAKSNTKLDVTNGNSESIAIGRVNSPIPVVATSGLMSLADVASRQLSTLEDTEGREGEKEVEMVGITGAIEERMVNGDDEDEDEEMDDAPPPLLV